jgi:hypothetical protein
VLFTHTKRHFWESVLESTTTGTSLHPDEYEDPRDIKQIKLNRIKANPARLALVSNGHERLRMSVFGQLHKELRGWSSAHYRRAFLSKGHGGQRRAFKVDFLGEGVDDYGGPYRAVFEQVVDELQSDRLVVSVGGSVQDRCLLPLVLPSPNRSSGVGANQDQYMLSCAPASPLLQELVHFTGRVVGMGVRHNLTLGMDLSAMFWRPLVRLPVTRAHLKGVDELAATHLHRVERLGLQAEARAAAAAAAAAADDGGGSRTSMSAEDEGEGIWGEVTFTTSLLDGSVVALCANGHTRALTQNNWREYVSLLERRRLHESRASQSLLRSGLACVLPTELLPLFTAQEAEHLFSGSRSVDVGLLKQCTEYEGYAPDCELVSHFWSVLEEFGDDERTLFLRFVWARR